MSSMAKNIVKALIAEGYMTGTANQNMGAVELIAEVMGLDIEDITITDLEIPSEERDVTDLNYKPMRLWSREDHSRFHSLSKLHKEIWGIVRRKE